MDKGAYFRQIPKVDALLERPAMGALMAEYGRGPVVDCIRESVEALRGLIASGGEPAAIEAALSGLEEDAAARAAAMFTPNLRRVINASGTLLHTNLGRAPLSPAQGERMMGLLSGYSNLEYNLAAGERGERYSHFEKLLCRVTGAEAGMAVNNNAAAVLLTLSALLSGKEAPVSRGELVEIGGKFRVPDVMAQSNAIMVEIGTTNKTRLEDYANAITENTGALLKVHTSNFRVLGFTESVGIAELAELAHSHNLPVIEDIGSGVLIDLSKYGLTYEPTVQDSIKAGADIVCFSGDKLLGGPQAGLIVGRRDLIAKIKKHPLTRALRIDKFTAGALELTLMEYLYEERAIRNIPALRLLTRPVVEIAEAADRLAAALAGADAGIAVERCESQVGGGSMPMERLESRAVVIKPRALTTAAFEGRLRALDTPIIARVYDDRAALDMRTVFEGDMDYMASAIRGILG